MKIGAVAVAYRESRLIQKHLANLPVWVDESLVLVSEKPWHGEPIKDDSTFELASATGATVIQHPWETETEQRNAGQDYFADFDWVIVLDPDEFLTDEGWADLYLALKFAPLADKAFVCQKQFTYWKDGYVADPQRDYLMLIACRPDVSFIDRRVVDSDFGIAPVDVHHFSWAKTDSEVYNKITHYGHAEDFDTEAWYNDVWLAWEPGVQDVHPTSPEALHDLIPAVLPPELEELNLWP